MSADIWRFRLLGGFRVESPSGEEVAIPSRKARALLALLALNDGLAITRESLGRQLWPDKPKLNQQQSLRQAIKDIREAFEPHQILEATRDTCRLSIDTFACDALECLNSGKDAGSVVLLPEMPEPAFESYRTELASFAPLGDIGEAARGAASLLEWTLMQEPARALELLHSCRELIPNMPLPLLESALRSGLDAVQDHPLKEWGQAQFATVLMWAGRCDEGIRVAKEALGELRPEKAAADWTAAAHSAAMFLIFRGRLEKARLLIEEAIQIAKSHKLKEATDRLRHAEALRLGYSGDLPGALKLLGELPENPYILVHRAIYGVLAGETEQARASLERAKAGATNAKDARYASQLGIAEGYILLAEGSAGEGKAMLSDLLPFCERYGIRLVMIHAIEGLALAVDEPAEATKLMRRAMELRERHRFPLLPSDKSRLARLLRAEEPPQ